MSDFIYIYLKTQFKNIKLNSKIQFALGKNSLQQNFSVSSLARFRLYPKTCASLDGQVYVFCALQRFTVDVGDADNVAERGENSPEKKIKKQRINEKRGKFAKKKVNEKMKEKIKKQKILKQETTDFGNKRKSKGTTACSIDGQAFAFCALKRI